MQHVMMLATLLVTLPATAPATAPATLPAILPVSAEEVIDENKLYSLGVGRFLRG